MKIAIVYGNSRKGSTYHCVHIVKKTMEQYGDVAFEEIWLPRDLPNHCYGCFNCILKGEELCPHREFVSPIINSLIEADGIIMASPVYGLDVSGSMKTLIDHLCYMWIPHRPHSDMFSKIGFVISTAAGGGTGRTNKTMRNALTYMGLKYIYSFGTAVAASRWEDVADDKKLRIERKLTKQAKEYYNSIVSRKKLKSKLFTKMFFFMMKGMIGKYKDGNIDKEYWRNKGWLGKSTPL